MATIYFSNNADSGDGSFREALSSSASGDTIEPAPSVEWGGETITIALASPISLSSYTNRVISGGANHRIRFDGQGSALLFQCTNCNVTFEKCDFVRGYRDTYGSAFYSINSNPTIVLKRCLFGGNKSDGSSGNGTFSTNSSSCGFDLTFESCVQYYDNQVMCLSARVLSCVYNNCTLVGSTATGSTITYNNSLRIGPATSRSNFVNLPPSPENEDWTNTFWQSCDARQVPGSSFLTGSTGELETDFLGNPRKPNGALGAIEGSWLIVPEGETETLASNVAADYAEISGGVVFDGADRILSVKRSATIDGAFSATDGSNGFAAFPPETNVDEATFDGVIACQYGANVSGARADIVRVRWTAEDPFVSVLIQKQEDDGWKTIAQTVGTQYSVRSEKGDKIRVFDGENFVSATVVVDLDPWKQNAWNVQGWTLPNWNRY